MKRLLLFGGTTEGRLLAAQAADMGWTVTLCVATDYGREIAQPMESRAEVRVGRMDAPQMTVLMVQGQYDLAVDATHPYATAATTNIQAAAAQAGMQYLRLSRGDSGYDASLLYADGVAQACASIEAGNVLAVTGSKEIAAYRSLYNYQSRLYARVLPTAESILLCREAGLLENHIIAAKGPFTVEQNCLLLRKYHIKTMVTKDGGKVGGFIDKLQAAKSCGVDVVVVRRPGETEGLDYRQVVQKLKELLG